LGSREQDVDEGQACGLGGGLHLGAGGLARIFAVGAIIDHQGEALGGGHSHFKGDLGR